MKDRMVVVLLVLLLLIIAGFGALFYWEGIKGTGVDAGGKGARQSEKRDADDDGKSKTEVSSAYMLDKSFMNQSPMQRELKELTEKIVMELKAEARLNFTMVPQLRAFRDMLTLIENYANKVETDIEVIKEISKNEFQEDVELQAALFKGKKSDLVAKHLEEFSASRVGAILAKMKPKEASDVLDVWAKSDNPTISMFYRKVMASYLNNKRRDENPELYRKLRDEVKNIPGT